MSDSMSELAKQGTFICGHPKSGTSLLMTLLDSHPQLLVYPEESAFFRRFSRVTSGMTWEQKVEQADHHLLHMFEWDAADPPPGQVGFPDRDYTAFSYERVKKEFREWIRRLGKKESSILPAALLAYGTESGMLTDRTRRWVEKTPYNEKYADKIFSLWPAARCIHVIRDPRDNYTSYRRKHPDWSPRTFAYSWNTSTSLAAENQARFGGDRYLVVRFEDLLSDPEAALESIRDFLEIEDDPVLRKPTRAGRPWGGNSMFGDRFAKVSRAPLGRWKGSLDENAVRQLEAASGTLMRRWGYALSGSPGIFRKVSWMVYVLRRKLHSRWKSSQAEISNNLENEDE